MKYSKAWSGLQIALDHIHGSCEESFQLLFNWATQIEISSPSSIVEVELEKVGEQNRFKRIFVALKPCIDGFLDGCKPFIGLDASSMNGKYLGQLVSATGLMDIIDCTILLMVFLTQRLKITRSGSCKICTEL